ncbi:hypothetical protein [Maricaulis maris]|uniref:hypothetical protein n=1 Tax=Maricaulis maris TaxID=74318 RepID=UPI003B8C90ED
MIKTVKTLTVCLALALGAGGLAAADSGVTRTTETAPRLAAETGEKRLQRRHHRPRHDYRPRRGSHHDHGYRRGQPSRYRYASQCWESRQQAHFRGRPALVAVRLCRDRHGRTYTVRGSTRLIHYIRSPYRRW